MYSKEIRKRFGGHFKSLPGVLLLVLLMTVLVAGSAYAAMELLWWDGPVFTDSGYQLYIDVDLMSNPDKQICLTYSVDDGASSTLPCSCTQSACNPTTNVGTWVCTIPTNDTGATITWDMSGWTSGGVGGSCGSVSTDGPYGSFTIGPTAVELSDVKAVAEVGNAGVVAISGLLGLSLVAGLVVLRSRRHRSP